MTHIVERAGGSQRMPPTPVPSSEDLYGRWAPRTPHDVADFFADYAGKWWIAGGWAIEAFTGVTRPHGDIDPAVLLHDLPLLRRHLAGRLHAWSASAGALRPLLPDDRPDAPAHEVLLPGGMQLWTRPNAHGPWEYDIQLTPGTADQWIFKRDARIRRPWSDTLWQRDGIWYLAPEVQLLHKAKDLRPKDQRDFDVTLPLLSDAARLWLREALSVVHAEHPWLSDLRGA